MRALAAALLLSGCGGLTLDGRFHVTVDEGLAGFKGRIVAALGSAVAQLQTSPGGEVQEIAVVTAAPSTGVDGYVDTGDRSTMYLSPERIGGYADASTTDLHLRVLVAHEFGHMLGRDGHPPCDGDQNVMAQNCLPASGMYSRVDVEWICGAASGGVCASVVSR